VADDRDAIDSLAFRRWQTLLAFTRGSRDPGEALGRRPNRPLYAGAALALVVCLVVGVKALVAQGPPEDWDASGTLVIDRDAGGRYLAVGGTLRPVLNLTSLRLLSGGALPRSVQVDHGLLAGRSFGPAIGIQGAPDQPPALIGPPARWVACQGDRDEVHLLIGLPPGAAQASPDAPGGILASASGSSVGGAVYLITGTSAYRLASAEVLVRLGYTADQVRTVPRRWLDLIPKATPLELLRLPQSGGGAPGAPFMADGTLVLDQSSGLQYLAAGGELHRVVNRTSLLLLDRPVRSKAQVSPDAIAAQPQGEPFGLADAPASPPSVPGATSPLFACTSSDDQPAQVLPRLPRAAGLVPATPPTGAVKTPGHAAQVWLQSGHGVLVRASEATGAGRVRPGPVFLVTEGVAYPVVSESALAALGYQKEQVRPLPRAWLRMLPRGPSLRTLKAPSGLGG
jgi:Type VII secretion system ESX-1, transport TM domain B